MRVRRLVVTLIGATTMVFALAAPALADVHRVRAAAGFSDYFASNDGCGVLVDEGDHGLEVRSWCDPHGRTWFTVRVRGVAGAVEEIRLGRSGDCSGISAEVIRSNAAGATVRIREAGRFDCAVRTVAVTSTG